MKKTAKKSQNPRKIGTGTAQLPQSLSLKTRCRDLTVLDYIRMVCEGDLSVLVVSGTPLDTELERAKSEVLAEFAELAGATDTAAMSILLEITELRRQRVAYLAALLAMGDLFDEGKEFFRSKGFDVSGWSADKPEKAMKRINSAIKAIDNKMALAVKEYNKTAVKAGGKAITEADIRMEMAILSTDMSHAIDDDYNLASYAVRKKVHKEQMRALEAVKLKK